MINIEKLASQNQRNDLPEFAPGDKVKVQTVIYEDKEGKERIQVFEGTVIKIRRSNISSSFTVRRISYGVGVEKIFSTNSKTVRKVEVVTRGKVNRAKLYYLRELTGKAARIQDYNEFHRVIGHNNEKAAEATTPQA